MDDAMQPKAVEPSPSFPLRSAELVAFAATSDSARAAPTACASRGSRTPTATS